MVGHSSWDEVKHKRAEQDAGVTRNPYCQCDDHLSIRMTTRIAEAENAARVALDRIRQLSPRSDVAYAEIGRLARLAQDHERLAEALRAVLEGGF